MIVPLVFVSLFNLWIIVPPIEADVYAYPGKALNLTSQAFRDRSATFGADIPQQGIEGILSETIPRNACSPIMSPTKQYDGNVWFALIQEAKCSYSHQVLMAQQAGFRAAIVYSMTSDSLVTMDGGLESESVNIPAVYVGMTDGKTLKEYNYRFGCGILITPNIQIPLQLYLIPFAIVVGVCFVFMCIFTIARFFRYRLRQRRNRLSPANLKKIPTKRFKKGDLYDMCAICLDEYEIGDKLRLLRCGHAYHCRCVDPWLTRGKRQCPVCKRSVVSDKSTTASSSASPGEMSHPVSVEVSVPSDNINDGRDEIDVDENTPLLVGGSRYQASPVV